VGLPWPQHRLYAAASVFLCGRGELPQSPYLSKRSFTATLGE
jgi:hypothetical protein